MIGQKGIPATHGGVERHVEELAARLVSAGHQVTVFTRPGYTPRETRAHRGVDLVSVPTVPSKHLDAIVHSLLCTLKTWSGGYDIVHYHAIGPCLVSPLARIRGRRVVATIHGRDWQRGKWNRIASTILRLSEWMALRVPNATICVSESLAETYRNEQGRDVVYIPNGISIAPGDDQGILDELGVPDRGYLLFAGRLVPEKGLHHLLAAFAAVEPGLPLVVAGDASLSGDYVDRVKRQATDDVIFAGYVYGDRLAALFRHAALFILPSELEGLPIVLLEALAYGAPVLASDIPPNLEVLGARGSYFRSADVADLSRALTDALARIDAMRADADDFRERAVAEYDWDRVCEATAAVYASVAKRKGGPA